MDETGAHSRSAARSWLKRIGLALGVLFLLLAIFHRPLLQYVGRRVAIQLAAGENLKLDFRLDGSVLGGVVLRNVHAVATGPSAVQSIDADVVRVDYSLWNWMTKGVADLFQNVEVKNATIVLDPAKAPPEIKLPKSGEKFALPPFFPSRVVLDDVNLRYVSTPKDLLVEHLSLELNPRTAGALRIGQLQLASGRAWSNIRATTSYGSRVLVLHDVVLDEQTKLRLVQVDGSRLDAKALSLKIEGEMVGGEISTTVSLGEKKASMAADIDFVAENLSLETLTRYLAPPKIEGTTLKGPKVRLDTPKAAMRGVVKRIAIKMNGQLERPSSWDGTIVGRMENIAAGGLLFDSGTIDFRASDGTGTFNQIELKQGASAVTVQGTTALPDTLDGFGRSPASLQLRGKAPDLAALTAEMAQPIKGEAEFSGRINVQEATVLADFNFTAGPLDFGKGRVQRALVNLRASRPMPPPDVDRPYFEGLVSEIGLDVQEVRFAGLAVDSVSGSARTAGQKVTVEQLLVQRRANRLTLRGEYLLPGDFAVAAEQPAAFDLSLDAPVMGDFWEASDAPDRVTGALQVSAQADYRAGLGNGAFSVYGTNLRARNLQVQLLSASGSTAANVIYLNDLTARLNTKDYLAASGQAEASAPFRYDGRLAVNIANLATFAPVLKAAGRDTKLGGALTINWEGSGLATKFQNTGALKLKLERGRYGDADKLQARVEANYSPAALNVPIIFLSSDKMMFQAVMQTREEKLEVSNIAINQGAAKYAGGYISLPFVWQNLGTSKPLFPPDGQVLITFQSENLDLEKLAKDFGKPVAVGGVANIKVDAHGTLENLQATVDLNLSALRSGALQDLKPASFVLGARLENNQLVIQGKLEQARIEPIQVDANLPLNVATILENRSFDQETPISAKVRMARSSINFVRQFVPALDRVDGDMALDVAVAGTLAQPSLTGTGDIHINVARLANPSAPAVSNFNARLVFDGQTLTFPQFRGELAGGPFTVSGRITFPKLTQPTFDLQLQADSALVARNDSLTARVDAKLRLTGPFNRAAVTGDVALTNSHFLKDIDLLPIGLPGRPPPTPEPPSSAPELSFPEPPLRDWTFDVAIKTKDPFSIRGNLANGGAIVDLKLTGTGLHPVIQGLVRMENVEATLPFSRLEISQGFLYFNADDPLNPRLDLQGQSLIRDYTIRVYIYGTIQAPEAVFSSEPPLPQEEIISLLATGTTREELLGNNNVLAGRAAMLLVQQLYHKIFRKSGDQGQSNSVFDRLQLDIGAIDPRTGQQTATARFKVNQNIILVGDLGVLGDFRGRVKYLIRFR